jgi:hypothetical protein
MRSHLAGCGTASRADFGAVLDCSFAMSFDNARALVPEKSNNLVTLKRFSGVSGAFILDRLPPFALRKTQHQKH